MKPTATRLLSNPSQTIQQQQQQQKLVSKTALHRSPAKMTKEGTYWKVTKEDLQCQTSVVASVELTNTPQEVNRNETNTIFQGSNQRKNAHGEVYNKREKLRVPSSPGISNKEARRERQDNKTNDGQDDDRQSIITATSTALALLFFLLPDRNVAGGSPTSWWNGNRPRGCYASTGTMRWWGVGRCAIVNQDGVVDIHDGFIVHAGILGSAVS
jgi:hypothetical protein